MKKSKSVKKCLKTKNIQYFIQCTQLFPQLISTQQKLLQNSLIIPLIFHFPQYVNLVTCSIRCTADESGQHLNGCILVGILPKAILNFRPHPLLYLQ